LHRLHGITPAWHQLPYGAVGAVRIPAKASSYAEGKENSFPG